MKMKLSDYVMQVIEQYVDDIFLLSGGGIMHLVDSVRKSNLNAVCCHHEQTAAIAAEGYARIHGKLGVALGTTGPGGTNMITGAAGAWLDSVPTLYLSGQVKTDNIVPRKHGVPVVRQIGFQELNIIDMVKPMTKYAVLVEEPEMIRYEMEKAIYHATHGRPGPVWVDIPLDIQAAEIDPDELLAFNPAPEHMFENPYHIPMDLVRHYLEHAERPMVLVGSGVRLAGGVAALHEVLQKFNFNVATNIFTADDVVTHDYNYYLGRQGMPGNEAANYAMDNCDVLLIIGARMQLTQTSYDYQKFAPQAKKIMVDVDSGELHKKTLQIDLPIKSDAKYFLEQLAKQDFSVKRWDIEVKEINPDDYQPEGDYLNVFRFIEKLNSYSSPELHVATADGMASVAPHQALKLKDGQRFVTNAGLGHMGSGLPLAIGVCVANDHKPTLCMTGDGSIMLNIQELQTIMHHKLPIKIFLYNNDGYYSIRNTHKNYFGAIFASDKESGVSFPDFEKVAQAFGMHYERIANDSELEKLDGVMSYDGPIFCELIIHPYQQLLPKWAAGNYS